MPINELIVMGKDVLLGMAALSTSSVAVLGLTKWRQELRGKHEFDAARNLIRATYKLRNEIKNCRAPFVAAGEFPSDYDMLKDKKSPQKSGDAWHYIYKNRWELINLPLQDFDTSSIEAEALWGEEVRLKTDNLRKCLRDLSAAIQAYISDKYSNGDSFRNNAGFQKEIENKIWNTPDENNEFSIAISDAISGIEEFVKPYLKRS